jgi:hypothetical protein
LKVINPSPPQYLLDYEAISRNPDSTYDERQGQGKLTDRLLQNGLLQQSSHDTIDISRNHIMIVNNSTNNNQVSQEMNEKVVTTGIGQALGKYGGNQVRRINIKHM